MLLQFHSATFHLIIDFVKVNKNFRKKIVSTVFAILLHLALISPFWFILLSGTLGT